MQQPPGAGDAAYGALGGADAKLLADCLVPRRVKGLPQRIHFNQALRGKNGAQLADRHAEAFTDRASIGLLGGRLQSKV